MAGRQTSRDTRNPSHGMARTMTIAARSVLFVLGDRARCLLKTHAAFQAG